jgi:hypothetical protein
MFKQHAAEPRLARAKGHSASGAIFLTSFNNAENTSQYWILTLIPEAHRYPQTTTGAASYINPT